MPADRLLIRLAILDAAEAVKAAGRAQVLTQDVVRALRAIAVDPDQSERKRGRAEDMADAMELFCSGLGGRLFNRPGTAWPESDVTIFEMGLLARDGYHSELALAYVGLINHVTALVERHQQDTRQTLMLTDEGHVVTTNPLLSPYAVKITKLWRSFGAWFWLATQNLEDFPDAARRMLNMMEWWLCLAMPKDEVEQIARFRALSEEERHLLLSAHKEPGKFIEGVVLADRFNALFRSVPPALALALAMTEKHEKAERAAIMKALDCSELEAAYEVARRLERARSELADIEMTTGDAR